MLLGGYTSGFVPNFVDFVMYYVYVNNQFVFSEYITFLYLKKTYLDVPYRKINVSTKKLPIFANNGRYQREKAHSFINTYVRNCQLLP